MSGHLNKRSGAYGLGDPTGDGVVDVLDIIWANKKINKTLPSYTVCPPRPTPGR